MLTAPFDQAIAFSNVWEDIRQTKVTTDQGRKQVPQPHHKQQAWLKYRATVKSFRDHERVLAALEWYRKSDRVKRGFVMDAGTFMNNWQEWWEEGADRKKAGADDAHEQVQFFAPMVAAFLAKHGDPSRSASARAAFNEWAGRSGEGQIFADWACNPARDFWDRWSELAAAVEMK